MGVNAVIYAGALVFVVGCVLRVLQYSRMPRHLRWELYPVPHGDPGRIAHGGSEFEDLDAMASSRHESHAGELRIMVPEILFLRGLWEFNRSLWRRSFPFHAGLYLMIASAVILGASALVSLWDSAWVESWLGGAAHVVYTLAGVAGAVLVLVGSVGLLLKRLRDPELSNYTTAGDIFNLLFFAVTVALLLAGYAARGSGFPGTLALTRGLLTLRATPFVPAPLAAGLVLLAVLTAYIPYTHMSHFIGKFFTYHAVRWDDAANVPSGKLERKMAEYLTYRPTWSAAHIGADGARPWAEIARGPQGQGARRPQ
ncbi:MAG TPA: respiratory nitrate reductase subunit gamma [bacterium]|nr:respiratory nitrate reductase subunit gamma [bacterium]